MYLNNFAEYVKSKVYLFTDDTVLYLTVKSQNSCLHLQSDLNINLKVWEQDWLMSFNPETPFLFYYSLHEVPLKTVKRRGT